MRISDWSSDVCSSDLPVAAQWPTPTTAGAPSSAAADLPWQALFADPKLRSLIDLALQNNRDMRVAALNVEKARAQYRIQRSDLVPQIGVTGQGRSEDRRGGKECVSTGRARGSASQ